MKTCIRFAVGLVVVSSCFARDFLPEGRIENVPASDTSVQQCYIFRTVPGVLYRLESTHDLTNWTAEDEIYGVGHEHVVAMREFTPPPPPPPGSGNPVVLPVITPARLVGLRVRPSSGAAGGAVVSWRSLDDETPVSMLLAQTPAPGWYSMPFFSERYGNYYFNIGYSGMAPVPPPAEVAVLGPKDAAMYAQFETSFPSMNQSVIESTAHARNTPPPAPPDPNSRKFWRVYCDWGLDTDMDGTPDWMEFEMEGTAADGLRGDAFLADTNHNGIPDGEEMDYDQDGVADAKDQGADDASATYPIGPVPRYALFPITNANSAAQLPPDGRIAPLQISDKGTVLYADGTWTAGTWTSLTMQSASLTGASARAINDNNVILGFAAATDPDKPLTHICYWSDPGANTEPAAVATVAAQGALPYVASTAADGANAPGEDLVSCLLAPGPVLSNDGSFHAAASQWDSDRYVFTGYQRWTLPGLNAVNATASGSSRGMRFDGGGTLSWGLRPKPGNGFEFEGGLIQWGTTSLHADFVPTNVATLPNNVLVAMSGNPAQAAKSWHGNDWHADTIYAQAIDISTDGTAIGKSHEGKTAPILINGKWTDIERYAPGITGSWHGPTVRNLDTTPGGWVLAGRRRASVPESLEFAAMLPVRAKGLYVQEYLEGVVTDQYVGVDDFSIGCIFPIPAVNDRIWIMAPLEGSAKSVTFTTPVDGEHPLVLSAADVDFGNAEGKGYLYSRQSTCSLQAKATAESGDEHDVELKLGEQTSFGKPLALKVMKSRTVKITLYKVTKQTPGKPDNTADQVPDAANLQKFLNDVYGPQINVRFNVMEAQPLVLDWDTNPNSSVDPNSGNGELDCNVTVPSPEQRNILDARPTNAPGSNIDIFLIGTDNFINSDSWAATLRIDSDVESENQVNACWIVGDALKNRHMGNLLQTIAHEIGHVMIAYGHPDATMAKNRGPADLPGTNNAERLMVSGKGYNILRGHLLVKQEWDEAEKWLETEEANGRIDQ